MTAYKHFSDGTDHSPVSSKQTIAQPRPLSPKRGSNFTVPEQATELHETYVEPGESFEQFADSSDDFGIPRHSAARAARPPADGFAGVLRLLASFALIAIAAIHYKNLAGQMHQTPYLGWMYIGLITTTGLLAAMLLFARQHSFAWQASIAVSTAALIGYCISRTTGLPDFTNNIGNWGDTLGVYSLTAEAGVIVCGLTALARIRHYHQ